MSLKNSFPLFFMLCVSFLICTTPLSAQQKLNASQMAFKQKLHGLFYKTKLKFRDVEPLFCENYIRTKSKTQISNIHFLRKSIQRQAFKNEAVQTKFIQKNTQYPGLIDYIEESNVDAIALSFFREEQRQSIQFISIRMVEQEYCIDGVLPEWDGNILIRFRDEIQQPEQ